MKTRFGWGQGLVSVVVLGLLAALPDRSNAGCQSCEYNAGVDAYVCYFVGYGQVGWTNCTPEWASEAEWCKFDGTEGLCTEPGGPCCYRYPAFTFGKKRPWLTTQVLLFDLGGVSNETRALSVRTSSGLDPTRVADALRADSGEAPLIVGSSVQSSQRWTSTRYEATDGVATIFVARSNESGSTVDVYSSFRGQTARRLRQLRVGADQAVVVPVEIGGRACLAVVYTTLSEPSGLDFESVRKSFHEPFTAAVEAAEFKDLMPLLVDSPRAADVGVDAWALRAVVANALAVSQRRPQ